MYSLPVLACDEFTLALQTHCFHTSGINAILDLTLFCVYLLDSFSPCRSDGSGGSNRSDRSNRSDSDMFSLSNANVAVVVDLHVT